MRRVSNWMDSNLATQGYFLAADERRRLRLGLRFATGLCLPLVVVALVLESPAMLLAMAGVGLVAGFTPRHPFDLVWNRGVRHVLNAPAVPPNPVRRRHAFQVGSACLLAVAALFAADLPVAAFALGGLLVAACSLVTATNFCVPSFLSSLLDRRRARSPASASS
jgi:hypothetical protein